MMSSLLNYFHPLERLIRRRRTYPASSSLSELHQQLVRLPEVSTDLDPYSLDYIVVDFETTGMDAAKDIILSVGWVELSDSKIDLGRSCHLYINDDSQIKPETVVINHITPQMLRDGVPLDQAMQAFMQAAVGKIIIAHGCVIERNFVEQYLQQYHQLNDFPLLWLDTLTIEKAMAKARNNHEDIDLTLGTTRERYGLPEYNGHNALVDALATAELFVAQKKRLAPNLDITFGRLYRMCDSCGG